MANQEQPPRAGSQPRTGGPQELPAVGGRILVVDDNVDATRILRILLQLDGHEVQVLNEGAGALAAVRAFRPDVVLLDIGMPGMDGYAVARQLRADGGAATPMLVAVTGFGREDDARRCREAGFDQHVTKPVERETLQRLIALRLLQRA